MNEVGRDLRDQRIWDLRGRDLTVRAIAADVGMSANGVWRAVQRLDCDPRYSADLEQRRARGYRRPEDHPCSVCGKPCWKPDGSLRKPGHQVVCLDCRRAATAVDCAFCGEPFIRRAAANVYCSMECTKAAQSAIRDAERIRVNCSRCGDLFPIRPYKLKLQKSFFCSRECRYPGADPGPRPKRGRRPNGGGHVRRAIAYEVPYERGIRPLEVFHADGWRCGLCGKGVDRRLVFPDPMRVSLDHIIPLSVPGTPGHVRGNVQCSHLRCNIRKNNRVIDQLPSVWPELRCRRGSPFCSGGETCPHAYPIAVT